MRSRPSTEDTGARRWLVAATITALYAVVVITASVYHEPWRDEVVPLSMARRASSLAELAAPLKFEGHPILWYVVVREAYALIHETWALKAASVASAVGAILLFTLSPLPWWIRCLFPFSLYPLYQYSVVSRGYGLEMLLLFAFCALHPHRREHPVALALVLAALANTEALGFIISLAAVASLLFEGTWRGSGRRVVLAASIYVAGLALAAAVAFPDPTHRGTGVRELDLWRIAAGIGRAIARPAGDAGPITLLPAPSLWVWAYLAYLMPRPAVLCFAAGALVGVEAFFDLVHHPALWHVGNVVLVVIAAMWLDASASTPICALSSRLERARSWLGRILAGGMTVVLTGHVIMAIANVRADLDRDYSSNRRLAEVLGSDPSLAGAVVMGEPDAPVTSLPYYAGNAIYLPREDTFRAWGVFAPPRRAAYDLDALLQAARTVHGQCGCPVIIAMGWDVEEAGVHTSYAGTRFEETFLIAPEASTAFRAATRRIASLRGPTLTDERYDVYVLR